MHQRIKIEYMEGSGGLEVVDLRNGTVAATLNAAGDVFEQNMHGNAEFLVCSTEALDARNTPGKASFDEIQRTGDRSGFASAEGAARGASGEGSDPARGTLGKGSLPPGAGEPGSSVPDVRIPESQTEPSPSSSDVPADRQAQNDAARSRNSPTTRR